MRCTQLQKELTMPKERLLSTLALVRSGVEFGSPKWELDTGNTTETLLERDKRTLELAQKLMGDVAELAENLEKGGSP